MYPVANGSFSDHFAKSSYCRLKEKLKHLHGFPLLHTQVQRKSTSTPLQSHIILTTSAHSWQGLL